MVRPPANPAYARFIICAVLLLAAGLRDPARLRAQNAGQERDAWQRPDEVMDALGIKPGSAVADVGCGAGYSPSTWRSASVRREKSTRKTSRKKGWPRFASGLKRRVWRTLKRSRAQKTIRICQSRASMS